MFLNLIKIWKPYKIILNDKRNYVYFVYNSNQNGVRFKQRW